MSQDPIREVAAAMATSAPENTEIGNLTMRPMTAGTAALCALAGNNAYRVIMGGEFEKLAEVNDYDVTEFLFIHCAPEDEVRRAVTSPGLKDKVLRWGTAIDFGVLLGARRALESVKAQLDALKIEVEPQKNDGKESEPPNS